MLPVNEVKMLISGDDGWCENRQAIESYSNDMFLELVKDIKSKEVCYHYALGFQYDNEYDIDSCEESHDWLEAYYRPVELKDAKAGDVISYYQDRVHPWDAQHFAVIEATDGTWMGTKILSKWGRHGIFRSSLEALPDYYGNMFVVWRKNY